MTGNTQVAYAWYKTYIIGHRCDRIITDITFTLWGTRKYVQTSFKVFNLDYMNSQLCSIFVIINLYHKLILKIYFVY